MHNHDHHPTEKKSSEYMCKIRSCLEIFATAEELARHEREPHYKCDCGAAFFTKFELVRHKREDPCEFLVCDKCDINFFDADPASRHQYAKSKSYVIFASSSKWTVLCKKWTVRRCKADQPNRMKGPSTFGQFFMCIALGPSTLFLTLILNVNLFLFLRSFCDVQTRQTICLW